MSRDRRETDSVKHRITSKYVQRPPLESQACSVIVFQKGLLPCHHRYFLTTFLLLSLFPGNCKSWETYVQRAWARPCSSSLVVLESTPSTQNKGLRRPRRMRIVWFLCSFSSTNLHKSRYFHTGIYLRFVISIHLCL